MGREVLVALLRLGLPRAPTPPFASANERASCIGFTEADRYTFTGPTHQDRAGALYSVAPGPVLPAFVSDAVSPLVEPVWGADLALARAAQAVIAVWREEAPVTATPAILTAIVGEDVEAATAAIGLRKIDAA